ncbi:MAG: hypothetical protein ABI697_05035 [Devosia sp.]
MTKIGFDPKPLSGPIRHQQGADVRSAHLQCALETFVTRSTGVEAVFEGLRLADIEGFEPRPVRDLDQPADDVNAGRRLKGRS